MGRAPCCDKATVKKGPWSPDEDATLKSYIEKNGTGGNWISLPQKIGLKRCGKSCRLRWLNYLRPNIKHGGFSEEEDNIICSLYISIGSRWSIIAAQLPGRTDNDIKNYWNTRLKKKLLGSKQRKDYSQNRRAGSLKQDHQAKREEYHHVNGDYLHVSGTNYGTYWPDQTNVPLFDLINNSEHCVNDEQSSITRLLMKLGAKFSDDNGPQVFDANSSNLIAAPNLVRSNGLINERLPGPSGFSPTELDGMLGCNSVKLDGLDCLYGVENMANADASPLINYRPMSANHQPTMMQPSLFEEPVHLGTQ